MYLGKSSFLFFIFLFLLFSLPPSPAHHLHSPSNPQPTHCTQTLEGRVAAACPVSLLFFWYQNGIQLTSLGCVVPGACPFWGICRPLQAPRCIYHRRPEPFVSTFSSSSHRHLQTLYLLLFSPLQTFTCPFLFPSSIKATTNNHPVPKPIQHILAITLDNIFLETKHLSTSHPLWFHRQSIFLASTFALSFSCSTHFAARLA